MPTLKTNSAELHYEDIGSGTPILMIAGIASDSQSWAPLIPLLEDGHRLILIDNRGAGQTKADLISIPGMVNDCIALLDHLALDSVDMAGHSMGGMISLRLAATHPARVRRLVVIAAGAEPDPKTRRLMGDLAKLFDYGVPQKHWFKLLYQFLFARPFFADPANVDAAADASMTYEHLQSPEAFRKQVSAVEVMPTLRAGNVVAPVLALAGEEDIMAPAAVISKSLAGLPDFRLRTIAGAGHSLHWDAPKPVAEAIRTFLD